MNALDLLFGPVPNALCAMFEYGILPKATDFLELTPEQYRKYIETFGDVQGKIYMLVSHNPRKSLGEDNDIMCLTENEKNGFLDAIAIIDNYCKDKDFTDDEQKLRHAASLLPDAFTKGTKYAACHNMKVVKTPNE